MVPKGTIACIGILLAMGCTDSATSVGADAAQVANVDASPPLGDTDARANACGIATSFEPSQITGVTPYGDLNLEFERSWFANGCGAMSMSMSYLLTEDDDHRFVLTFALPSLEFLEGKAYSEPGTFPVSIETSVCNLEGEECIFHDTDGSVEIGILVDDEGMSPNTNVVLNLSGDAWGLSSIEASGQSCAWTWNPC